MELPSSLRATAKDAIRKVLLELKSASEKFIFNFQQQTSHKTSNLYDVFAFTSCISEEGRPEDLHLEAFELLTVAEPSTPSTSWLSSQEAG